MAGILAQPCPPRYGVAVSLFAERVDAGLRAGAIGRQPAHGRSLARRDAEAAHADDGIAAQAAIGVLRAARAARAIDAHASAAAAVGVGGARRPRAIVRAAQAAHAAIERAAVRVEAAGAA